ncbi:unnamed protein product [Symbiodinium sp. CCMP2592]|nr:unnamed protein product [Symbiodinium sp. CCMP2592]
MRHGPQASGGASQGMAPSARRASISSSSRSVDHCLDDILKKMEEDWNVVQLLAHHRRKFKIPSQDMQTFTRQFCQLCLTTLTSRGQDVLSASLRRVQLELKAARQDFELKLARCNLGAMKQLDRVKGGTGTPLQDDHVTFFEPMRHLSEDQRLLVLMIVKDKLLQILDGSASTSFVEELKQSMGLDPSKLMDKASPKASDEDEDDVDLETALRRSKAEARAALRQAEEDRNHARSLQQELDRCRREVFSLKGQLAERQKQLEHLEAGMDKLKDLGLEPEEANFVLSELGLEREVSGASGCQGFEVRYDGVPDDCTSDCILKWHSESGLEADSLVAVQIEEGSSSPSEGRRQPSILCTYERHADAEKAVVALQDSVLVSASGKKSVVTASMSPPADTSGSPPSRGVAESKHPKPLTSPTGSAKLEMVEAPTPTAASPKSLGSLRDFKEFFSQGICICAAGIGEEVSKIANNVGLERLLACPSRFEILYQDAFKRIERLEELRKRSLEERRRLLESAPEPCEASVLSVVERSPLVILQQLLSEGPVGYSLISPGGGPKRRKKAKAASSFQTAPAASISPSRPPDVLLPLILPKNLTSASAPSLHSRAMEGRRLLA